MASRGTVTAELFREKVDPTLMTRLPRAYLEGHAVVPVRESDGRLIVYGAEDAYGSALEIGEIFSRPVEFIPAPPEDVRRFIKERYDRDSSRAEAIAEMDESGSVRELEELASDEPLVRLVDEIMRNAVSLRASDVHVEPYEDETVVRFRVDGVLREHDRLPRGLHPAVVSRLKILSRLDIAQNRLPQDGRIKLTVGTNEIDLRVSTVPTPLGERVVLRILDRESVKLDLNELGMSSEMMETWRKYIMQPHGIILVTGPTGSGKTTTLYSALESRKTGDVNMLTVEDPVEYLLDGVGQIQVNPKINLSFASGLRSILRQDPDIIMVGEIRDGETARIAVQASLTGHLVFSTLHTNDSSSAGPRLVDMGVEPYLIGSTLRAVLGQRLVRRLCPNCKNPEAVDSGSVAALGLDRDATVYGPSGCEQCDHSGYRGRIGLFEFLPVEGKIRELILEGASASRVEAAARSVGIPSLKEDGVKKILNGSTTPAEVLRATESV